MDSTTPRPQQTKRRNTRQRQLILNVVRSRCDHPTAEDIYLAVQQVDNRISRGTVYRNLNLLADSGTIATVKAPGAMRFDWRCDGHSHVVCPRCGAVADTSLPYDAALDMQASDDTGFAITMHSMVFEGICPECRDASGAAQLNENSL